MRTNLSYPSNDTFELTLPNDRLPNHVIAIGSIKCSYQLENRLDYYYLKLNTQCQITLCCQRCMESFDLEYHNQTEIGLCDNDEIAEQIMGDLDPVILSSDEIPFETIIIDELHLYLPLFHDNDTNCYPSSLDRD